MTRLFSEALVRQPNRWAMRAFRAATIVIGLLLAPWIVLARTIRPRRKRATDVLNARVQELWKASPYDAVALLRTTLDALQARGGFSPSPWKSIEVPPFGSFDGGEVFGVRDYLFSCEFALGRFEEAMQVSARQPIRTYPDILKQVDCLTAMGRQSEAIAHLRKNLDVDTWRGPLRRRLEELSGKAGGGVN